MLHQSGDEFRILPLAVNPRWLCEMRLAGYFHTACYHFGHYVNEISAPNAILNPRRSKTLDVRVFSSMDESPHLDGKPAMTNALIPTSEIDQVDV